MFSLRKQAPVFFLVAVVLAAPLTSAQDSSRFGDSDKWSRVFDSPGRDEWQKPGEVIAALGLAPEMVVADIGAGTGYFSVRLAKAVPRGRVYAADTEPSMVEHLKERVAREKHHNIEVVQATRASPNLPGRADVVLLVNVQGLIASPGDYFVDLKRYLKPDSRVAIISTRADAPRGPRGEMRVPPEQVKRDMARQGYVLIGEHDFLERQYFLVFRPASL